MLHRSGFFVTFWQMSLYDINPPMLRYEQENSRLRLLSKQANDNIVAGRDVTINKARREKINSTLDALSKEMREHIITREFTIKRLQREKSHWFASVGGDRAEIATQVVQQCLQPRALMSPMDADYCTQMLKTLHSLGPPGFSTLMVYDKAFRILIVLLWILIYLTASRGRSFGRCLLFHSKRSS